MKTIEERIKEIEEVSNGQGKYRITYNDGFNNGLALGSSNALLVIRKQQEEIEKLKEKKGNYFLRTQITKLKKENMSLLEQLNKQNND